MKSKNQIKKPLVTVSIKKRYLRPNRTSVSPTPALRVWAVSHHPLSARARVYGNTRLRSLPVDLGSDRPWLTLERRTVTWQIGYGHVDEHSAILQAHLSSLSAAFCWGVLGTTNKTIRGMRGWIWPRVSRVCSYPKACLLPTGTDLAWFTWGKEIFMCKRPGSSQSQKKESTAGVYALSQIGLHTTMCWYASFSFALWISGKPHNCAG